MGLGNGLSIFAQTFEVEFYRFSNVPFDLFDGPACGDTSRKIRNVGRKIIFTVFDNNRVLLHALPFSPAWVRTLFSVSGCTSSPA
jgi:hypothetical protein